MDNYRYQIELQIMMYSLVQQVFPKKEMSPEVILAAVCKALNLHEHAILSKSRKRELSEGRFIGMMIMEEWCDMKPLAIAMFFGRDRTTAIYGIRLGKDLLSNAQFYAKRMRVDEQLIKELI